MQISHKNTCVKCSYKKKVKKIKNRLQQKCFPILNTYFEECLEEHHWRASSNDCYWRSFLSDELQIKLRTLFLIVWYDEVKNASQCFEHIVINHLICIINQLIAHQAFTRSKSTIERLEKIWNMYKVNNKHIRKTSLIAHQTFTRSKSTIERLEKSMKYV